MHDASQHNRFTTRKSLLDRPSISIRALHDSLSIAWVWTMSEISPSSARRKWRATPGSLATVNFWGKEKRIIYVGKLTIFTWQTFSLYLLFYPLPDVRKGEHRCFALWRMLAALDWSCIRKTKPIGDIWYKYFKCSTMGRVANYFYIH